MRSEFERLHAVPRALLDRLAAFAQACDFRCELRIARIECAIEADMAQLKAWYRLPEYKPLIELRQRTDKSTLVAVQGVGSS
ncbi:MAG: DUF1330 domain-containing protein [Pseudomonadota bacterium]|nr:DUF1330 domain-containing protein [Pseudomonadota bacterium]